LFRHVSAMVLLREHPGHYELVRRVLGHSETSTTYNSYVALEADQATQLLAEAIKRSKGLEA
jgi:integrase